MPNAITDGVGLTCPACSHSRMDVTDSRPYVKANSIRRRRRCPECGHKITTFETARLPPGPIDVRRLRVLAAATANIHRELIEAIQTLEGVPTEGARNETLDLEDFIATLPGDLRS